MKVQGLVLISVGYRTPVAWGMLRYPLRNKEQIVICCTSPHLEGFVMLGRPLQLLEAVYSRVGK